MNVFCWLATVTLLILIQFCVGAFHSARGTAGGRACSYQYRYTTGSTGSTVRTRTPPVFSTSPQPLDSIGKSPAAEPEYIPSKSDATDDITTAARRHRNRSFIRTIRSHNLAGFVSHSDSYAGADTGAGRHGDNRDVVVSFFDSSHVGNFNGNNLIVITGETASGKSLFIVRALEILSGKITSSQKLTSYIQRSTDTCDIPTSTQHDTFVEVEVCLVDPHLSSIEKLLPVSQPDADNCKLDNELPNELPNEPLPRQQRFIFRRTLQLIRVKSSDTQRCRLKSVCTINGRAVPLKDFLMFTSPLFAIVDATSAINAIMPRSLTNGSGGSDLRRTAILDAAVSKRNLWDFYQAQQHYTKRRLIRIKHEKEIQQKSLRFSNTNEALSLLSHYVDELDRYVVRITKLCQSLSRGEENDDQLSSMSIFRIGRQLSQTKWSDNVNDSSQSSRKNTSSMQSKTPYVSKMYELLLEFRNELKAINDNYQVATQIAKTLGSLATSNSAVSAIHRSKKALQNFQEGPILQKSTESLYEVLNQVEDKLRKCVDCMEYDNDGLIAIFERVRCQYSHITVEHINEMVNEWNLLSRKHNISPYLLPQCHGNYRNELEGTNELHSKMLPLARSDENKAYQHYWDAYQLVTAEREQIARELSKTMTEILLPRLGFVESQFSINIHRSSSSESAAPPSFLVDKTDFSLCRTATNDDNQNHTTSNSTIGTSIHDVSSSGERARILFAIECALPGSIGMISRSSQFAVDDSNEEPDNDDSTSIINENRQSNSIAQKERWYNYSSLLPIATIYDEIDAHIGGRAVKAMTQLLVHQSVTSQQQQMAITHNPTLAAAANTHIIIQKEHRHGALKAEKNETFPIMPHNSTIRTDETLSTVNKTEQDPLSLKHISNNMQHQLRQCISVHVIQNDPYDEFRLRELVRMVCGSSDDATLKSPTKVPEQNDEAKIFVKSLIRSNIQKNL